MRYPVAEPTVLRKYLINCPEDGFLDTIYEGYFVFIPSPEPEDGGGEWVPKEGTNLICPICGETGVPIFPPA